MKSLVFPWVCALVVLAGCAQTPANPSESAPAVTSEEGANRPAAESAATDSEPAQSDGPELLHLWDEFGQFRQDFWESKTHDERVYALTVLSERGNDGATRALDRLEGGSLSSSDLVRFGHLIAKGGYGYETFPNDRNSGPVPRPLPRIQLPEPRIPPDSIPVWHPRRVQTVDHAGEHGLPIVVFFPDHTDSDWPIASPELAEISQDRAVFIKVNWTGDREYSPWHEEIVVPRSKLLSDNPARDYDVPVGRVTILITDSYGNEHFRMTKAPSGVLMRQFLFKVDELSVKTEAKLRENLNKAEAHLADGERRLALKYMLKNFREDVVGLKAQGKTIRAYHVLVDGARVEMEQLIEAGDKEGLQALAKEMRGSDLENEIDAAFEKLK